MAYVLEYDGQGQGVGVGNNDASESFTPKASFILRPIGSIVANVTFTVQSLPDNLPDNSSSWATADGSGQTFTSSSNPEAVAKINHASGFKYRIKRTGTANQNTGVAFYWGNVTTVQHTFG